MPFYTSETRFPLRKSMFLLSKYPNFRLRRNLSDRAQMVAKQGGDFYEGGEFLLEIPLMQRQNFRILLQKMAIFQRKIAAGSYKSSKFSACGGLMRNFHENKLILKLVANIFRYVKNFKKNTGRCIYCSCVPSV